MLLLTIDPGLRGCGVALFDEDTKALLRADYVRGSAKAERAEAWAEMAAAVNHWVGERSPKIAIELPRIRKRQNQRDAKKGTDPDDLIQLAAVVGAITACVGSIQVPTVYFPEEWKGQVPKKLMWERALKRLSPDELTKIAKVPASLAHNMQDAIELGLVHLGRLGKFSEVPIVV